MSSTCHQPLRFADFTPGVDLGTARVTLEPERFDRWRALFPSSAGAQSAPPGLLMALFMHGFAEAFAPHPDGNIHAGQSLAFTGEPLRAGESAVVSVSCVSKEIKRERRFARFATVMHKPDGPALMRGEMLVVWAI
jgi:hypothetical protein